MVKNSKVFDEDGEFKEGFFGYFFESFFLCDIMWSFVDNEDRLFFKGIIL